ncbi:unnamed protein product [Rhizophagus irregularis]|nr:unnamed protein product [Rhizophagus irregularis]
MFQVLFDLALQLTGSPVQFKHIHGTGWSCIIGDLDYAQAKALGLVLNEIDVTKNWEEHLINVFKSCHVHYKRKIREKRYDDIIANDMLALLTASSEVEINQLFDNIEKAEAEWAAFYRQKWIIASLNKHMSKIDNETWVASPNNTNTAEAAHALSNRRGKNLKIVTAILQGRKLDKERFTSIHVHQKYNVPNRGRDRRLITRNVLSNKRQANARVKKLNNTNKTVLTKRKQNARASSSKKKAKKTITIISDDSDEEDKCNNNGNDKENNVTKSLSKSDELEYQERALALKERELDLREREAKVRIMELTNIEKERELNLNTPYSTHVVDRTPQLFVSPILVIVDKKLGRTQTLVRRTRTLATGLLGTWKNPDFGYWTPRNLEELDFGYQTSRNLEELDFGYRTPRNLEEPRLWLPDS